MKKCTFRYPDGEVCGGDHAEQFCWGRHPELCKNPRVKKAILRRLNRSANQTSIEDESEDEEESGAWGDACGYCVKIIYPGEELEESRAPEAIAVFPQPILNKKSTSKSYRMIDPWSRI